ncbi:RNA polymerase sigma factor RpoE [Enterovibrio sp. ZSDZ35]|uniref:RNA polymerase sigma factor n=1 Tax=Enterovibrio qingdaonensis TaxID=2899818 RepID=A0ABT5QPL4_9GAMM|nr:RNA polymerase sigma factor RpoE [Enterovibrio sp. ZSDZ35]MDD1782912.1 RNA polymerase sigma factor RpoE [Enterovibrio sp. ZSDZ35]
MSEQLTDQALIERVQSGDKQAFNLLVIKYQNKVCSLISRYVSNSGDVPDVAQEAFIKAYRALPGFRGESAFYTWLYRIAVNTAKNYLVAQGRRPPSSDIDAEEAENYENGGALKEISNPENLMLSEQLKEVVFNTIEALPDDLKTAITLREIDGLSYEEIAEVMDCPVGTVRSRIFRAREAVDKRVRPLINQ